MSVNPSYLFSLLLVRVQRQCDGQGEPFGLNLFYIFDPLCLIFIIIISSVRSSNSHPDLLVITSTTTTTPLFQIHTGPQHWTFTF